VRNGKTEFILLLSTLLELHEVSMWQVAKEL
jgi:hypothetical protein